MSQLLLDSNLVRWLLPQPAGDQSPLLALYWEDLRGHDYATSFQSYAEALKGAYLDGWSAKRLARLETHLSRLSLLYPDLDTLKVWGALMAHAQKRGRRLKGEDGWVGATAARHGLTLVTHDKDLQGLDFPSLNVICRAD